DATLSPGMPGRPVRIAPLVRPDPLALMIYTLSLHDALPIYGHDLGVDGIPVDLDHAVGGLDLVGVHVLEGLLVPDDAEPSAVGRDRKSTRLNSSHVKISYAVFCLKKKNGT